MMLSLLLNHGTNIYCTCLRRTEYGENRRIGEEQMIELLEEICGKTGVDKIGIVQYTAVPMCYYYLFL